jgi:colicin import membrane protein
MKTLSQPFAPETEADAGTLVWSVVLSLLLHGAFLTALILAPATGSSSRFPPGVIDVSLVSLPAGGGQSAAEAEPAPAAPQTVAVEPRPAEKKPEVVEPKEIMPLPKAEPAPEPQEKIPLPAKIKEKTSLKKKTFDRQKAIDTAIARVEKKAEQSEQDSVSAAIERLREKLKETETAPNSAGGGTAQAGSGVGGSGSGTGSGQGGGQVREAVRIYQAEIAYRIQKNWAFSPQLTADSPNAEAVLGIKILASGEIEDIWFDKRSGNSYLDDSAYRAILKSNPLPPLPAAFGQSFYKLGLIFGPQGIK